MPWILNVPMIDVMNNTHPNPGPDSMLIQISDTGTDAPDPKFRFREVYQLEFLDVERDDFVLNERMRCSQHQADILVDLLKRALQEKMNVIVQCTAGICRSGAVCEIGVMMGFDDTKAYRQPNLLVKELMMKKLGWYYQN